MSVSTLTPGHVYIVHTAPGFEGEVVVLKTLIIYLFPLSTQVCFRSIYIYLNRLYLYVFFGRLDTSMHEVIFYETN